MVRSDIQKKTKEYINQMNTLPDLTPDERKVLTGDQENDGNSPWFHVLVFVVSIGVCSFMTYSSCCKSRDVLQD